MVETELLFKVAWRISGYPQCYSLEKSIKTLDFILIFLFCKQKGKLLASLA